MRHEQTIIYERCIVLMQTAKETIETFHPEASTSFDTARCFHAAPDEVVARGKALTVELVKMLSKFQR